VDKNETTGNGLTSGGVDKVVLKRCDPVVFMRQGRIGLPAAPLFDGQETGLPPLQLIGIAVVHAALAFRRQPDLPLGAGLEILLRASTIECVLWASRAFMAAMTFRCPPISSLLPR
jgi:hypothetical protein